MEKHTISDISTTLGISERTVQRWLETLVIKEKNKILVPQDILELLILRHKPDNLATDSDTDEEEADIIIQPYTKSEYEELHRRLSEYPFLKERIKDILNELDYHKKSSESHYKQMEIILNMMQQRNYIEAKEKKLDG